MWSSAEGLGKHNARGLEDPGRHVTKKYEPASMKLRWPPPLRPPGLYPSSFRRKRSSLPESGIPDCPLNLALMSHLYSAGEQVLAGVNSHWAAQLHSQNWIARGFCEPSVVIVQQAKAAKYPSTEGILSDQ